MGAQIAFQWGAAYPNMMDALLPFVGSARTATHNWIFLENVRQAIVSDPAWRDGAGGGALDDGLKRMQLVFDSWGLSQTFYRRCELPPSEIFEFASIRRFCRGL